MRDKQARSSRIVTKTDKAFRYLPSSNISPRPRWSFVFFSSAHPMVYEVGRAVKGGGARFIISLRFFGIWPVARIRAVSDSVKFRSRTELPHWWPTVLHGNPIRSVGSRSFSIARYPSRVYCFFREVFFESI